MSRIWRAETLDGSVLFRPRAPGPGSHRRQRFPAKVTGLPGMRETGVKAGGSNWRASRFRKPESTHWGKDGLCLPHIKRNTEKRTAHRQGRNASLPGALFADGSYLCCRGSPGGQRPSSVLSTMSRRNSPPSTGEELELSISGAAKGEYGPSPARPACGIWLMHRCRIIRVSHCFVELYRLGAVKTLSGPEDRRCHAAPERAEWSCS